MILTETTFTGGGSAGLLLKGEPEFMGIELWDKDILMLLYRFAYNFIVTMIAVRYIYLSLIHI